MCVRCESDEGGFKEQKMTLPMLACHTASCVSCLCEEEVLVVSALETGKDCCEESCGVCNNTISLAAYPCKVLTDMSTMLCHDIEKMINDAACVCLMG